MAGTAHVSGSGSDDDGDRYVGDRQDNHGIAGQRDDPSVRPRSTRSFGSAGNMVSGALVGVADRQRVIASDSSEHTGATVRVMESLLEDLLPSLPPGALGATQVTVTAAGGGARMAYALADQPTVASHSGGRPVVQLVGPNDQGRSHRHRTVRRDLQWLADADGPVGDGARHFRLYRHRTGRLPAAPQFDEHRLGARRDRRVLERTASPRRAPRSSS